MIDYYKSEWRRQIISVTGDAETADIIVELAQLNGLFDPIVALERMKLHDTSADRTEK